MYKGSLNGSTVCIKRIRMYTGDDPKKTTKVRFQRHSYPCLSPLINPQAFCQEAVMWKRLMHPNVLPLLGVTINPTQLISNWMSGGDLPGYIKRQSDADRLGLVGIPLSCISYAHPCFQVTDVTSGLCYLHTCNVVHGDLKGVGLCSQSSFVAVLTLGQANVLVDDFGHAKIADFGLAMVTKNLDSIQSTSGHHGHTPRWSAPEVLTQGTYSKEADIFSFAMVMIEVRYR